MPGAGKSTICSGLEKKGFTTINMGDAVRAEAKRRNLDPTGQNLGKLMLELREKEGQGAVAKLIEDQITNSKSDIVVIDGVRSNAEIDVLKKIAKLKLLAVHASTDTRYTFLSNRHRSDDPQNRQSFDERDNREIGVGIDRKSTRLNSSHSSVSRMPSSA